MLAISATNSSTNFLDRLESAVSRALDILIAAMSPDPADSPPRDARLAASQVLRLASSFGLFRSGEPSAKPRTESQGIPRSVAQSPAPAREPDRPSAPDVPRPTVGHTQSPPKVHLQASSPVSRPQTPPPGPMPQAPTLRPRQALPPAASLLGRAGAA